MSKKKKTEEFIKKIEFFYRNFGSTWSLKDFITNKNDEPLFKEYLKNLENKGVVKIINNDFDFEIIDLPSNHIG